MPVGNFIQILMDLRKKQRAVGLTDAERRDIEDAKNKFARFVCSSQNLVLKPDDRPRTAFRVTALFPVEVVLESTPGPTEQTITLDISRGGFSTLLSKAPKVGAEGVFRMDLGAEGLLTGRVAVVGATEKKRVSLAFRGLAPPDEARLEDAIIDAVLPRFA